MTLRADRSKQFLTFDLTALDRDWISGRENIGIAICGANIHGLPPIQPLRAWVDSKCVPQPIGTFTEAMTITGARERIGKKAYIRAASYANPGFDKALARLKADKSWRTYGVPCGHDVMVDMPERLTEILLEVA